MPDPMILEAVRTPFGRRGGAYRDTRPDSLLALALRGLVGRAGLDPGRVEDVINGTVTQAGEQGANVGRLAVFLADFPVRVPAVTLNRMCGSSQQAVHFAVQAVAAGDMSYVLATGVESMTRAPMFSDIGGGFEDLNPELRAHQELLHQGESAELSLADIDWFEVNEAFATVVLMWLREYRAPVEQVNPWGGAIAHGHPLGATGAGLLAKMLAGLESTGGRLGLQVMCIGHGMATATILERL